MQRVDGESNTVTTERETEENSIEMKTESSKRPDTTEDITVNDVIRRINEVRANVGVGSVKYDRTLNQMAQVRAMENAENNFLRHRMAGI